MSPGSVDRLGSLMSIPLCTVPSLQSPHNPSHLDTLKDKIEANQD